MSKCELTNKQWNCIQDMLPRNGNRGKSVERSSSSYKWYFMDSQEWGSLESLPSKYGCWKTIYKRFRLWTHEVFWDKVLQRLQSHFQSKGKIDW